MNSEGQEYREEAIRYYQEGYEKLSGGDVESAIELCRKSIEISPTAEAYTFLGWAYSFKKKYEEAIHECKKAIDQDPDFGNPYNDIGYYLIEQKKYDEAIPWLEKALDAKRYEAYCYPYFNLGRIWEAKGNWLRAMGYYSDALRENREYTLAEKAVKRMQAKLN